MARGIGEVVCAGVLVCLNLFALCSEGHKCPADKAATSQVVEHPFPYEFPLLGNAADLDADRFPMPQCHGVTLAEASIDELQEAMTKGKLTALQLLDCCKERSHQVDPYINSVLEWNPDAWKIARALDAERCRGKVRGPLHGIPFLVKDNLATKDKMGTTAGSWALLGSIVPRDAHVVAKARRAGAVLAGKATLSEWADMRSNVYSEGYSARGGQCRSPYNLTVNPGGSSSGSAAAVAANVVPFALGTETDGSVINPAERNALCGIKPTVGLTSRAGVVPESHNQDTVGTFGKTCRDAVYALDAIYGVDPRDNYTLVQKTPGRDGYSQFISTKKSLKGAHFGIPWKSFWVYADPEQQTGLLEIIEEMKASGATVYNNTELPDYETIVSPNGWNWDYGSTRGFPNESEYTVVKVDFYNDIKAYLSELTNTPMKSLEDLVAYNYNNDGTEGGYPNVQPAFESGQDGFLASLESKGVMDQTYWEALDFCHKSTREGGIDAALNYKGRFLDALLVPPDVGQTYQIAAQAGYPVLTIPGGVHSSTGMPYGFALMQTAWREDLLIKYGTAIEDLTNRRTRPYYYGYLDKNIPVYNL